METDASEPSFKRFHGPLDLERSVPTILPASALVLPGDAIHAPEQNTLQGHGVSWTPNDDRKVLRATLAGPVERISKLVTVRSWRGRYIPNVGDVVVGRITQVLPASRRWKVDIQARQDAVLTLFAIRLPGAVQRRRTREDELNMRSFYAEQDLIAAEVQEVKADGSIMLHTRLEDKLGKLQQLGIFVAVPSGLIRRTSRAFASLGYPRLSAVLGVNGYIWIYWNVDETDDDGGDDARRGRYAIPASAEAPQTAALTRSDAEALCRARNAVVALSMLSFSISVESIRYVFGASATISPRAMLEPPFLRSLQDAMAG
jgi:exosome complex component RRP4